MSQIPNYDSENLISVLGYMKETYGARVFSDNRVFVSYFSDLAPSLKKERTIVCRLAKLGLIEKMIHIASDDELLQQKEVLGIKGNLLLDGLADEFSINTTMYALCLSFGLSTAALRVFSQNGTNNEKSTQNKNALSPQNVISVKKMYFYAHSIYGWRFAANDTDYICSYIFIEPFSCNQHICIDSQIFLNGQPYSRSFSDEFDITPKTTWLRTTSWGKSDFSFYPSNTYEWRISIGGTVIHSEKFTTFRGRFCKQGIQINELHLFKSEGLLASKTEANSAIYGNTFDIHTLKHLSVMLMLDKAQEYLSVISNAKLIRVRDGVVVKEFQNFIPIQPTYIKLWLGISYKWECGEYCCEISVGENPVKKVNFSIIKVTDDVKLRLQKIDSEISQMESCILELNSSLQQTKGFFSGRKREQLNLSIRKTESEKEKLIQEKMQIMTQYEIPAYRPPIL